MNDILIVEDDRAIMKLLSNALNGDGYKTLSCDNGGDAISLCSANNPDLILLDLGLPDMDGTEVIKRVREWSATPILIISAREREKDKITALDLGADDYITKPFSTRELLARVRAVTRRTNALNTQNEKSSFTVGDLTVNYAAHEVSLGEKIIALTAIEFKILQLLSQNAGKVLTHNFIINKVWGVGASDSGTLRVFIAGIRRKIEKSIGEQQYIKTEIGVGYKMNIDIE